MFTSPKSESAMSCYSCCTGTSISLRRPGTVAAKFFTLAPNIWGPSVCNLPLGEEEGGGWLLDFWKILTFTSHTNKQQNALQSLACILFTIFSTFFDRYCGHLQVWCFYYMNTERYKCGCVAVTPSSYICHGVGPLVDPFRSHVSRSLFKGLPWFLLPVGQ